MKIFNTYQKMIANIPNHDLARAKNKVISKYLALISTPTGMLTDITNEIIRTGEPTNPTKFVDDIMRVGDEDMRNLLNTYFYDVDPCVVAHGQVGHLPDYFNLRSWTHWNRW